MYANTHTHNFHANSLVDACLFGQLVDLMDRHYGGPSLSYERVWNDMRACVDRCHKDGERLACV